MVSALLILVDALISELIRRSGLTEAQVETISLRKRVMDGQLRSIDDASLRSTGPVKLGTFYRVLNQSRRNVERSIFSILLSIRLGVLSPDELNRLSSLVSQPGEMDEGAALQVMNVLEALVKRLVTL